MIFFKYPKNTALAYNTHTQNHTQSDRTIKREKSNSSHIFQVCADHDIQVIFICTSDKFVIVLDPPG